MSDISIEENTTFLFTLSGMSGMSGMSSMSGMSGMSGMSSMSGMSDLPPTWFSARKFVLKGLLEDLSESRSA